MSNRNYGIMDTGIGNCKISELKLKQLYSFLFIGLVIVTSSCRPSESQIVTAMAQTEIVRSATNVVEAKKLATESAMGTSAAQSTFQAATVTRVHQETATRAAEETAAIASTIVAATASASPMHGQVKELVNSGILSHANGAYYSLPLDFNETSGDDDVIWLETGFMPTDFVLRFNVSCPNLITDDMSGFLLEFRQNNGNAYIVNLRLGIIEIVRFLEDDLARMDKVLDDLDDNWKPGDEPNIFKFNPWLGSKALPEDVKEIRVMLVVEDSLFYVFADSEKLFRAYDTNLISGNLRIFRDTFLDSDCQMKNVELWLLD